MSDPYNKGCISPSDLGDAQALFDTLGIPRSHMAFYFNEPLNRWEIRDLGTDVATLGTLQCKAGDGDAVWARA